MLPSLGFLAVDTENVAGRVVDLTHLDVVGGAVERGARGAPQRSQPGAEIRDPPSFSTRLRVWSRSATPA
jgi:hypothetical protein